MVAQKATSYLGERLNTVVKIDKVDISFFKFIRLENFYIEDLQQDTLIYVENLDVGIDFFTFEKDSIVIDLGIIQVDQLTYNLQQLKGDSTTNLNFIIQSFSSSDSSTNSPNIYIYADDIVLTNAHFIWDNDNYEQDAFGVDWDHINLTKINGNLTNFVMVNDSFNATFSQASFIDKSGFQLDQFKGDAIFSSTKTAVTQLKIVTPYSNLNLDLDYSYDSLLNYTEFIDQVYMNYTVDSSAISMIDISYFAPALEGLDYDLIISGKERGPVSDMKFQDLFISYGNETVLRGRVFITGLPDIKSTFFTCKFKQLSTTQQDLSSIKAYPFTGNKHLEIPGFIKTLGIINYKGQYTGFYNNFVTYGTFTSNAGVINTDVQIEPDSNGVLSYKGQISTTNLDLNQLVENDNILGEASVNIQVEGRYLIFDKMNATIVGKAEKMVFMGYEYNDIVFDGTIKDQTIQGELIIADTNLNLAFDGSIGLKNELPKYAFTAKIRGLHPKQLNLLDRDSSAVVNTDVLFNFTGNSIDNILGRSELSDFSFSEKDELVELKSVAFIGYVIGKDKTLSLISDNIDLQIAGEFYYKELFQSMKFFSHKWFPSIFVSDVKEPKSIENFDLRLRAHKFSGFSQIFIPQVAFRDSLRVDFSFDSEKETADIYASAPEMTVLDFRLDEFTLDAEISSDTLQLLSEANKLFFTDSSFIELFNIQSQASKNILNNSISWSNAHSDDNNNGHLNFDLEFVTPSQFSLAFHDSWMEIKDSLWTVLDSSRITKYGDEITFSQIEILKNNHRLELNGMISDDPTKELFVRVDKFDLSHLNPILNKYGFDTKGNLSGTTKVSDVYHNIKIHSYSTFDSLEFNTQYIGDGSFITEWNDDLKKFDIQLNFSTEKLQPIAINGGYYPLAEENNLDLNLDLDHFPVKILEPILNEYIDEIDGAISGSATIEGPLKAPIINGDFKLNNLSTRVVYLNEKLTAHDQNLFIRDDLVGADAIIIQDEGDHKAEVNLSLYHNNFSDINFDVAITSIDLFRAFNTSKKDNEYFYGQVILAPGSSVGIDTDYEGNLNLNANITSGKGTEVFIPFYDDDEVAEMDYIYFKNVEITSNYIPEEELIHEESMGLNLDMSLDLNKDAQIELIFDEFTSDKIQATGNGVINLIIDSDDNFNIYGNYEIIEGYYLFTFSKIISKRFSINPNSRLTWNGSPYEGQADITASYEVRTSLRELGLATTDTSDLDKRIPVEVILTMTNNYMNPDLSFSFNLPPKYDETESLLNTLEDGEKNKQVFGLLILNKFMPVTGNTLAAGSNILTTNSTEVLTNQLSNWLSRISNDVDIGLRYSPGDKITSDEVELALATQLFNDRILFETNIGYSNNTSNSTTSQTPNNLVTEFTLSYKINEKGNIVAKVFNRSNELNPVYNNVSPYTQGIGVAYTEPFNTLDNLGCILSNNLKSTENKRDCNKEYRESQLDNKAINIEKVKKKVIKSREKQKKQDHRKAKREAKATLKNE